MLVQRQRANESSRHRIKIGFYCLNYIRYTAKTQQILLKKAQIPTMKPIIFFLIPLVLSYNLTQQKTWTSSQAHSDLIVSLIFYNDDTKMVSGSSDSSWKVWDTTTYAQLHQQVMGDSVTHVNLHPSDNRIFVLAYDGEFAVYDPDDYSLLHSSFPAVSGNTIAFFDDGNKFVMAGYDSGSSPQYYIYNSTDYSLLQTEGPTSFAVDEQITVCVVNENLQKALFISLNQFTTELWDLTTNTQQNIFNQHTNAIKSVIYHPDSDDFYTCGLDQMVFIYTLDGNGDYQVEGTFDTSSYGDAYVVNAELDHVLLVSADAHILLYDLTNVNGNLTVQYEDQDPIFVMDVSHSQQYLVTGMGSGKMSLWSISSGDPADPTDPEDEELDIALIAGVAAGGFVVLIIIAVVIYCCACRKKKSVIQQQDQVSRVQTLNRNVTITTYN